MDSRRRRGILDKGDDCLDDEKEDLRASSFRDRLSRCLHLPPLRNGTRLLPYFVAVFIGSFVLILCWAAFGRTSASSRPDAIITSAMAVAARNKMVERVAEFNRLRTFDDDAAKPKLPYKWKRALLYAYVENRECAANFNFLIKFGRWDLWNASTLFVLIVNGHYSSIVVPDHPSFVVVRRDNVGYDLGAHKAGLAHIDALSAAQGSAPPDEYGFLNCGMSGPFLPSYSTDVDWFGAYSSRLSQSVRLVGAYITCLEDGDLGGYGPHVESHSFFTDRAGVDFFIGTGVLRSHTSKLGAIIDGEWALSTAVFAAGGTIDTLLYRYQGVNWTDPDNFQCNKNRFVGRAGQYGGFDINPFETIFFKRVWKTVIDPSRAVRWLETARLMEWRDQWFLGLGAKKDNDDREVPQPPSFTMRDDLTDEVLSRVSKFLRMRGVRKIEPSSDNQPCKTDPLSSD